MRHFKPLLAAAALVLSTVPVYADVGDQLSKFLPDDGGAAEDQFGFSVAISGTTAVVGAKYDDDNGDGSGSAYVFDISDPANPTQVAKLLAIDGAAGDHFGHSVAISDHLAIVGAYKDNDNGNNSGSAYLFDTTTGDQIAKLLASDGSDGDEFGFDVVISGDRAIVGATNDDDNGDGSGSAYLFDISDPTNPIQIFKFLPYDGAAGDWFGRAIAISGTTTLIAAEQDQDNGYWSGSAYLFDTSTGDLLFKLVPDDGQTYGMFGTSVAISSGVAIVGAEGHSDDDGTSSGCAYLFDTSTGQQIAKLLPDDGAEQDNFGSAVEISGTTAIIGAAGDDDNGSNSGSAYLFDISDPANPIQVAKLLPDDGAEDDRFAWEPSSVAINDNVAIIGARGDDGDNGPDCGSAYLFDAAAPSPCPWDLDGDGAVGPADLAVILGNWGPVPPNDPIADLNNDGVVGPADLAIVLGNWGPC